MDNEVKQLYLDDIIPNRFQPRENFDEQALKELAVSIKEHGVIQPIVVRQIGEKYEIIAGERRYKASTMAGLTKIPAIIKNLDDKESSKVALIENLQRKDLTPIEEARTYQKILELDALTQEELARTMGKSQSAVSNKLRLLSLTDEVQDALLKEQISERHARSLLNIQDPTKQVEMLQKVISSRMTVRELDQEIKNITDNSTSSGSENPNGGITNNILPQNPINNVNPTIVDIDKIRNESVDISQVNKPILESSNGNNSIFNMNVNKQPEIIENKNEFDISNNKIEENKNVFIPNFENIENNNVNKPKEEILGGSLLNKIPNNGEKNNINNEQSDLQINSTSDTVNKIKTTINNLKESGKKIDIEEFDFDDFYQLVIRVDK